MWGSEWNGGNVCDMASLHGVDEELKVVWGNEAAVEMMGQTLGESGYVGTDMVWQFVGGFVGIAHMMRMVTIGGQVCGGNALDERCLAACWRRHCVTIGGCGGGWCVASE